MIFSSVLNHLVFWGLWTHGKKELGLKLDTVWWRDALLRITQRVYVLVCAPILPDGCVA